MRSTIYKSLIRTYKFVVFNSSAVERKTDVKNQRAKTYNNHYLHERVKGIAGEFNTDVINFIYVLWLFFTNRKNVLSISRNSPIPERDSGGNWSNKYCKAALPKLFSLWSSYSLEIGKMLADTWTTW